MSEWTDNYTKRIPRYECHYGKIPTKDLIELTRCMTVTCAMGRPACSKCPLRGDSLYCPPVAAHKVLTERGYEKITIYEGITSKKVYSMNTITPMEFPGGI